MFVANFCSGIQMQAILQMDIYKLPSEIMFKIMYRIHHSNGFLLVLFGALNGCLAGFMLAYSPTIKHCFTKCFCIPSSIWRCRSNHISFFFAVDYDLCRKWRLSECCRRKMLASMSLQVILS